MGIGEIHSKAPGERQQQRGLVMAAIFCQGWRIIRTWTVGGDHVWGVTAHGMTHTAMVWN